MARIAGVDLPREKKIEIGLTYIFGIGRATARRILESTTSAPHSTTRPLRSPTLTGTRFRGARPERLASRGPRSRRRSRPPSPASRPDVKLSHLVFAAYT